MPELPEVETNLRNLARWTVGRRIVAVKPPPGTRELGGMSRRTFARRLAGRTVVSVARRGKWMLCVLDDGGTLGLHLGMTGKIVRATGKLPRFARAVFTLDDGTRVCFVDSRRFGRLVLDPDQEDLGPDALTVTPQKLGAALARTSRSIKEAIMDQNLLAGVGNLYAAEALWRSRIHPLTPARAVAADPARTRALATAIRASLRHGLKVLARTEIPEYIEEGAPNPYYAYDRAGLPCRRCGIRLEGVRIGGRQSAFCPSCQPVDGARAHR
jgi:formamidopyrimidine-DNA glycosylase